MTWKHVGLAKVHRLFYPQVAVVVTVEATGRVGAMPASWCIPLSFNPPFAGLAIASEHEIYKMIVEAQALGINWLDYSHAQQIGELGEISGSEYSNKLSAVELTTISSKTTSQPIIREPSAALECRLHHRVRFGTHELMVSEVIDAHAADHLCDYWDFSKYTPLLYAGTVDQQGKCWVFMSGRGTTARMPFKHQT